MTRRFILACVLLISFGAAGPALGAIVERPELGHERVVFHTVGGDFVFALYPKVAPETCEQFLKMVRAGLYDGTHFHRLDPTFVLQNTGHYDRLEPLSEDQKASARTIKAEFSKVPHRKGILSMAHPDGKPDGGESSFSILLANAPHLDGNYTVFGEVVQGMGVIDMFMQVPRDKNFKPKVRLTVEKAEVADSPEAFAAMKIVAPTAIPFTKEDAERIEATDNADLARFVPAFAGVVLALMLLVSVAQLLLADKVPPRALASIQLISVLVGTFFVVVLLTPVAQHREGLAILMFLGILGLFKLMGRFEAPAPPPQKPPEVKKTG